jgi:hypothetical protein
MNYSSTLLLVVLLIILVAGTTANAKTFQLEISSGNQVASAIVSYDPAMAYAGNTRLEITVSVQTTGTVSPVIKGLECAEQPNIRFTLESSNPYTSDSGLLGTQYKFRANIPEGVDPRRYPIAVSFSYPDQKNDSRCFDLPVSVRNNGKLSVISDGPTTTEFFTGTVNKYPVEFENKFEDYPTRIKSVTIKSKPLGIVESTTVPLAIVIDPRQRGSVTLDLPTAPMSFSNLLNGFSDSNELILQVTYEDGNGHVFTDLDHKVKLKVKPRDSILIIAMLIGVVIGAVVKCFWQPEGNMKRAILKAICIGLGAAFIAVVARIKVSAFDFSGDYDNPAMLAIISGFAAFGGIRFLRGKNKSSEETSPAPTTARSSAPSVS